MSVQTELLPLQFPKEAYHYGERSSGEIHGVVLTKPHIVELILDLAGYTTDADILSMRLLEPSCGHGAFLIPAAKRLLDSLRRSDRDLKSLKNAITAFDVDTEHVVITKRNLSDLIVSSGFGRK